MRIVLMILILCCSNIAISDNSLVTIGWVEPVRILPEGFELKAKIDTGADNSSLGVIDWKGFTQSGTQWVRFEALNNEGKTQLFERPLHKYTLIKRKLLRSIKRPVVKMWLCIGRNKILTPVNLSERKKYKYSLLIGRSFLKTHYLVDSAKKSTTSPECN